MDQNELYQSIYNDIELKACQHDEASDRAYLEQVANSTMGKWLFNVNMVQVKIQFQGDKIK